MIFLCGVFALLQVSAQPPSAPQASAPAIQAPSAPDIAVQLGVSVRPDTVTVGERFVVVVRVRAPRGATIEFPQASDSAATASLTATQMIAKPVVQTAQDSAGTLSSAAYRLAAWDVGPQNLGLPDVIVRLGPKTGYVSLANRTVFVKSVLPADSTLRVPKPPRARIALTPFDWLPWIAALAALVAAGLIWRIWVWYRRRKNAPVDPYTAAMREFDRIAAMHLVETGEPEKHVALMTDVMRDYLAARVPGIERSQTSSELLVAAAPIHETVRELGEILWRADLVKFAGASVVGDEASRLGAASRAAVEKVEEFLDARDEGLAESKAA
jgi:hypothetical protein